MSRKSEDLGLMALEAIFDHPKAEEAMEMLEDRNFVRSSTWHPGIAAHDIAHLEGRRFAILELRDLIARGKALRRDPEKKKKEQSYE